MPTALDNGQRSPRKQLAAGSPGAAALRLRWGTSIGHFQIQRRRLATNKVSGAIAITNATTT
jgi:hypothetical protein